MISKEILSIVVVVLFGAVAVLCWQLYEAQQKNSFSIGVGKSGITVETPK